MSIIKDIKQEDSLFLKGTLYVPLFEKEAEIWIENTVDLEYAEKCAEHLVNLNDKMIDDFCERAVAYYKFMLEEWGYFEDIYEDIVDDIKNTVPEDISGRDILKYIYSPNLFVFPPEGDGIGYSVDCQCVWEPEHGLDLIIRDDKVLYVGESMGLGAWSSDEEYEVPY